MNESDIPQFPRRSELHASEPAYSRKAQEPDTPETSVQSPETSQDHTRLEQGHPEVQPHESQTPQRALRSSNTVAGHRLEWERPRSQMESQEENSQSDSGVPAFAPRPVRRVTNADTLVTQSPASTDAGVSTETMGIRSRRLEQERQRARKRRRNRRIRSFFILALIIALLGGAVFAAWNTLGIGGSITESDDYKGLGVEPVQVTIFEGALGTDIGNELIKHDVVKTMDAFLRAFEANKAASSIRPGTYSLKTKMSASEAIAALLDEANRTDNTVTVIPGQTLSQVVSKMREVTEFDSAAIDTALADPSALGLPAEANGNIEGWLAPGSYELAHDETPVTLLKEMIAARIAEFDELKIPQGQRQSLLIKASILEREVNKDEYLPKVARVIENRLADPAGETVGRLQMDSTVLYGVGKTGGIPTAEDLASDTPYNTYKIQGIPAGPISNPEVSALKAMAAPAEGSWLYFVTINLETGETRFASTSTEHEANKALLDEYCSTHQDLCFK